MSKKVFWTIMIIMSLSLIGVGAIQYFWILRTVDMDEKNFNDKVTISLNNVKKKITREMEMQAEQKYYEDNKLPMPRSNFDQIVREGISSYRDDEVNTRIRDMAFRAQYLNPDELLENIDKDKLDRYLRAELKSKDIHIPYEYGVFSNAFNSYFIENNSYTATIGDTTKSSNVASLNPLYKAEYKISLFDDNGYSPGHLNLFFPGKKRFLWSNLWTSFTGILLSSVVFTGLILFCFAYTIYIIFRQKKISEMKTDFINNMTHEFKTPIATISLASDSILSPTILENKDKVSRFVNIIRQENKRMLSQVEKVLQMAQIDKENVELKFVPMNLHEIINDAVINAELKVQGKGGDIKVRLDATNPVIMGDVTHISSMINNLLDNAEKYTKVEPHIVVSTQNTRNGIEFSIADNGIGMDKDAIKYIFEKFYRVHTGNLHDVKGFGLGLSYVKAMVDAHHGRVYVQSEPGKGSTFTVFLPFTQNNQT